MSTQKPLDNPTVLNQQADMNLTFSRQRLTTGVTGLDDLLGGGLPAGQMYLLEGDPGTGKTTLAMQFIQEGTRRGEKSLYVTLSEPLTELHASIASHGWNPADIPIAEFVPAEASLSPEQQYTVFHPSEVELATTIQRLTQMFEEVKPERLVIDSLSELRLLAADTMRYRRQLLALKQFFAGRDTTVLLLDDRTADGIDMQLQSIAHGVIRLERLKRNYGVNRRRIEILKLRASAFREGAHDYTIQQGGLKIFPRLVAAEHLGHFEESRIEGGLAALDAMFGGGIGRGSSTLIIGPTGAGKSTLALQYAYAAASRGDRAIVYSFDEVLRVIHQRAKALKMDLGSRVNEGTLAVSQVDPAELSPGEFAWQIRSDVEENDTRVVVIDSLNGFISSMPGEDELNLHLHELISYLNQKGVATFVIMTQSDLVGNMRSQADVSYLADTVVLLRYFEAHGEIRRAISVLKQRVGEHERTIRELSFADGEILVGQPLASFRGVLTGVPEYIQDRT